MEFSPAQVALGALAGMLVGMTKTGVVGLGLLFVPIMASIFPPKESTGVLLPLLLFADVFAIARYRKFAQWGLLVKLLPWVVPGVVLGYLALWRLPEERVGTALGVLVLCLVAMQVARRRCGEWLEERLPRQWWFSAGIGLVAGFATMLGNLAGAFMSVYLISMGLRKHQFMGTGAWYYLLINGFKIPFSASLGLIDANSLTFDLMVAPFIAIGAFVGFLVFNRIPQVWFNRAILVLAAVAGVRLLLF